MKYKVCFSGFAYVEAEDVTEAVEAFDDDDFTYKETKVTSVAEVDEFIVEV
jgi:hypothetical protein